MGSWENLTHYDQEGPSLRRPRWTHKIFRMGILRGISFSDDPLHLLHSGGKSGEGPARRRKNKRKLPIVTDAFGIVESRSQRAFFFSNELPHRANTRPSSSFTRTAAHGRIARGPARRAGLYESITTERELAVVLFTHNWFRDDDDDVVVFADKVQGERTVRLLPFYLKNGALFQTLISIEPLTSDH